MSVRPPEPQEIELSDSFPFSIRLEEAPDKNMPQAASRLPRRQPESRFAPGEPQDSWTLEDCPLESPWRGLSPWSRSWLKRLFDCACVVLTLPVTLPLLLVIAVAVRLTSRGPVVFLQKRVGLHGRIFTIIKFRTLEHRRSRHHSITTSDNQRFTPVGPVLRRWKLDELPQIANVLFGHMSLVGPRPKLAEHVKFDLPCRPGITGMATIVFAKEEAVLARIPQDRLEAYYHSLVLPMKRRLDGDYMACATFLSDLELIVNSVLRRWDSSAIEHVIAASTGLQESEGAAFRRPDPEDRSSLAGLLRPTGTENGALQSAPFD